MNNVCSLCQTLYHCQLISLLILLGLWSEVKWKSLSLVWLFVTPWTIQSMEFSRPEYSSGYPFPSPGDLPNPGKEPRSPALQADSLPAEPPGKPTNTGVGSLSLLQQTFPTRNLTGVSFSAGRFFTFWAPGKPLLGLWTMLTLGEAR